MRPWHTERLGALADFRNGLNYTDADQGKGLAVIGVADFQDRVVAELDSLPQLAMSALSKSVALIRQNDVVFVRSNGNRDLIGRSLFVKEVPQVPTSHSGFTIRCRFKDPRCEPRSTRICFEGL
jgi:type I restriction enzyme, S subunit